MSWFKKRLGILRSVMIYYWKPFNKRRLKQFYGEFIKKGDLCFDIGAHLGNRTDAWLNLGARVIAVEPQPGCITFLENNFSNKDGFKLVKKAVGQQTGMATLHISNLTPTVTTLADKKWQDMINDDTSFEVKWDQTIEVPVTTLDILIEEFGIPDFCKIDVENFELEVLLGLNHAIPALSIEFFKKTTPLTLACLDRIDTLGTYEFNWSFGESQKMELTKWVDLVSAKKAIEQLSDDDPSSGDLYARLIHKNEP